MGTFADMMYTLLLGWVSDAVRSVWLLLTGADAADWFRWVLDNWLMLVAALCAGGLVVDLIVHLLRWQPYRVWASFLHNHLHREKAAGNDSGEYRRWVYADGSTRVEEVGHQEMQEEEEGEQLSEPLRPVRPIRRAIPAKPEKAYNRPVYPPQWQHYDDPQGGNP